MTQAATLAQWLDYIQRLHPSEIDMGLDRVKQVAQRLGITRPAPVVITVTGTNGKGSHVAALEALSLALNLRVGAYTSPHILSYNERVRLDGQDISDQPLVDAFERIEQARGDISLSYFEFGTLAALIIFQQTPLDVVVLEVGLGGRLDAVNIIDADVAIISSIGLDHQEYLGNSRESVAREKAGIMRAGKPVVCVDANPPANLLEIAESLASPLYLIGREFNAIADGPVWRCELTAASTQSGVAADSLTSASGDSRVSGSRWQLNNLPMPRLQTRNVAGALQAAVLSGLITDQERLNSVLPSMLPSLQLAGRLQYLTVACDHAADSTQSKSRTVLLDVSHNPQAVLSLAVELARWRKRDGQAGQGSETPAVGHSPRIRVILAMMQDKDHIGYVTPLEKHVDFWYIAHVDMPRCIGAEQLAGRLREAGIGETADTASIRAFTDVGSALDSACREASPHDLLVVCGSFFTVSDALHWLSPKT
ncbi:MAG: bifunctional tetrahydrofolate synthase/dihydrofolate synthase [Gammaproteobacteria bacterium]|nr:bifunctional tetrahydrofolate synthase/dihydrofolate synthase [Gammaproteobacteria bacterium]MBJ54009.1 bifunctional tetrahydrofolate synthase/dihydrofolate synthase [Gammaproteobacteria bacterium]|tara:strand:+ start:228 stop:1670 length:1443 start_codon:yes stop_codon:yes gene_type:complete